MFDLWGDAGISVAIYISRNDGAGDMSPKLRLRVSASGPCGVDDHNMFVSQEAKSPAMQNWRT